MPLIPLFVPTSGAPAVLHLSTTTDNTDATSYVSSAFTPVADDLLVVFVAASFTLSAGALTNSAGLTFNKVTSLTIGGVDTSYLYVANQKATAVSQTVTFACSDDQALSATIVVARVTNMSRTGATASKQTVSATGAAAGTPAATFAASVLTENPTLAFLGNASNPANVSPPVDWTEREDTGHTLPQRGTEYATRDSGFTGTTITWGSASASAFGVILIELDSNPAAGGANTSNWFHFF